ncbi:helix-turn-helix domain-containing protein [Chitinimonas arctica]|uniref:helix-turn-helix domain-containing protein n=1 Tax=Chitinimonas arctica TaxID=2594795 RepID=UPI0027E41507|nr:hypothetical protein [Chitinimonas arctica]
MDIRPIRTDADYQAAIKLVSAYFDAEPEPGTEEADHFEVLVTLVHAYEDVHFPVESPDPIEAIKFRMDQLGMSNKDLEPFIGKPNRVSEVLNRRRGLSLNMIRKLRDALRIPADSLLGTVVCCSATKTASAKGALAHSKTKKVSADTKVKIARFKAKKGRFNSNSKSAADATGEAAVSTEAPRKLSRATG